MKKVKELKGREYFTKKHIEFPNEKQVWFRIGYDFSEKKYICQNFDDCNKYCYMSGKTEVYTDFTF